MRLAQEETHDPALERQLRSRAMEVAAQLSTHETVIGVLLTGSAARGPVSPASDIDLHVIATDDYPGGLPEWSFDSDGTIHNIHVVPEAVLSNARQLSDIEAVAAWFFRTRLGDELSRFVPLWWRNGTVWQDQLSGLLQKRTDPKVATLVSDAFADSARQEIVLALDALSDGAGMDAHQHLRMSFQLALIAALISRQWIIRGSKKRIEVARSFLPDPPLEQLLTVGLDVMGLTRMTSDRAQALCTARLRFRQLLLDEYRRLSLQDRTNSETAIATAVQRHEQHNAGAHDYYSSLVASGMFLGPVNHIRCLSGLPLVPHTLLSCVQARSKWPIQEFARCCALSVPVRDKWLEIGDLTDSLSECAEWSQEIGQLIDTLQARDAGSKLD